MDLYQMKRSHSFMNPLNEIESDNIVIIFDFCGLGHKNQEGLMFKKDSVH